MIIFGWGKQTIWNVGAVFKQLCSHCNNEEYWVLVRKTTWFTLFFVPVIPYKTEWLLICPVCKYGVELKAEQVQKFRPIAEINKELMDKKISSEQYQTKMAALTASPSEIVAKVPEPTPIEAEAREIDQTRSKFCGECGKDLLPQGKFCIHCGTQVTPITV